MITLSELESFFATHPLPESIQLDKATHVGDVAKMVKSHITILKANPKRKTFKPYYMRLVKLKTLLT